MSPSCEVVAAEMIEPSRSLSEPTRPPWIASFGDHADPPGGRGLAALAGTPLAQRFCSWTGLSGRRYVFSVYPASDCPAFCDAIMLAAARDDVGRLRVVSVRDTGAFPEPVVARAERELRAFGAGLEFHLHLLASSAAERAAAVADLANIASRPFERDIGVRYRRNPLKRLISREENPWIFLPLFLDFPSYGLDFPSGGFGKRFAPLRTPSIAR